MNRLILSLFLICQFALLSMAQNVRITGKAYGFSGTKVRLVVYADQISYNEKKVAETTVKPDGSFEIATNVKDETCAFLYLKNIKGQIYLEPGKSYDVSYPEESEVMQNPNDKVTKAFIPLAVALEFNNMDTTSLNFLIGEYNYIYNSFIDDNYQALRNGRNKKLINELREKTAKRFAHVKSAYFNEYVRYRMAGMEMWQMVRSNKEFIKTYFDKQKPLWNNEEYMSFFNSMFSQHLSKLALSKQGDSLMSEINERKSYSGVITILASDTVLLPNDTLRELVLLKGLNECYNKRGFNKESIITILSYISKNSLIEPHRNIAASLIEVLTKASVGTIASNFNLTNIYDEPTSLDIFKGKLVYLSFWAGWSVPALEELSAIDSLKKKYSNIVEFVSISGDDSPEIMKSSVKKNKFDWNMLYAGYGSEIFNQYNVSSYPTFVLIDENGKILANPALMPSEGIDIFFAGIIAKQEAAKAQKKSSDRNKDLNKGPNGESKPRR